MPAKLYSPVALQETPDSERKVRERLATIDNLIVFHSIPWLFLANNQREDTEGEADFVLVVPDCGILVLEVKGGTIEMEKGSWFSTDKQGNPHDIKNPFLQAQRSMYKLLNFFDQKALRPDESLTRRCWFAYGVVFPDMSIDPSKWTYCPRALVLDRNDLQNPLQAIRRIFKDSKKPYHLTTMDLDFIVKKLAPTFKIKKTLKNEAEDAEKELLMLTQNQIKLLWQMRGNRRASVIGSAGTGKTVLALEKTRDLFKEGFRTYSFVTTSL